MKILYITPCWTGFADILFDGGIEGKGMPAFIKPLKKFCERGDEIDVYILHAYDVLPNLNIKAEWAKKIKFLKFRKYETSIIGRIKNSILINMDLKKVLKNNKYDFIYAHGSEPQTAYRVIRKSKIPYGHRIYGGVINYLINTEGYYRTILKHYNSYKVFTSKKEFLLITDDSGRSDLAYKRIVKDKKPYQFVHWLNGADKVQEDFNFNLTVDTESEAYLVYVARIDRWKGQHRAIELLKALNDNDIRLRLYFVGQISKKDYYEELKTLAAGFGLSNQIVFTGGLERNEIYSLSSNAVAALAFYPAGNRGNVFYEYLAAGAAVISLNDGSLDDFIINGENGFLLDDISDGVQAVKKLLSSEKEAERIKSNAKRTFDEKMKTWDERVQMEIDLINKYAGNKR